MRRFFVPPGTVAGPHITLGDELAHRLGRVLRLRPGDRLVLADGRHDYEVEVTAVSGRSLSLRVVGQRPPPPEPGVELILYQALIRANRFELVLEKGTEVGVSRFVPVISSRSQVRLEGESARMERWRRILREAAEQCGRAHPPEIEPPQPFEEAMASASGLILLPWEGLAQGRPGELRGQGLGLFLRGLPRPPAAVSLFIGPEGGFDPREVELARRRGAVLISLGPRILRSETAGIVVAALVLHELGEMGG